MAWQIDYDDQAKKDLRKLDRQIAQRILKFMGERVATLDDPRSIGEGLQGPRLGDRWKYRVGDYRNIADIQDKVLRVYVVAVGNRREVYR